MYKWNRFILLCIFLSLAFPVKSVFAMEMEAVSQNGEEIASENLLDAPEDLSGNETEAVSENEIQDILSENSLDVPSENAADVPESPDGEETSASQGDQAKEDPEETPANAREGQIDFIFWDVDENNQYTTSLSDYRSEVGFFCLNYTDSRQAGTVSSADEKIVSIQDKKFSVEPGDYAAFSIRFLPKKIGSTDITVEVGGEKRSFRIHVVPDAVDITDLTQTSYQTLRFTWKKAAGCSGYYLERSEAGKDDYKILQTLKGENSVKASVNAPWEKKYDYRVVAYITDGGKVCRGLENEPKTYAADRMGVSIASVQKSGASSLKITWKTLGAATGYELYRSTKENRNYKKIYTANKGTISSYTQKVSKGITYYYRLVTVTPAGKSNVSATVSQLIPKAAGKKTKKLKIKRQFDDEIYYYEAGGRLHIVQKTKNLKIYTMTAGMNVKSVKTVKLGKYDKWGGFYHGPDGKFYVAVGFFNRKESKSKTVIQVMQYSSGWKKLKTATIKGSAKNAFEGICEPFRAGTCRMDMNGNTLYVHTARTMFKHADGLNHQSNISFVIDTGTMKAQEANDSYVSHSFDQYVKFKDGSLYLLDHGDAYPRALTLTAVDRFGTGDASGNSWDIFNFMGKTGDNYTGCQSGGMEVGGKNILTTGVSRPHKYKIKGVTGFKFQYANNLYLTVTDRATGKTTVKWLTRNNPKSQKVNLNAARMVKLSDDRFAIVASQTKNGHASTLYVVVDGSGRKIYAKNYAMAFDGEQQPILINGSIVWMTDGNLHSIPAVY